MTAPLVHVVEDNDSFPHVRDRLCKCGTSSGPLRVLTPTGARGPLVIRHRTPPIPRRNLAKLAGPLPDLSSPDWTSPVTEQDLDG